MRTVDYYKIDKFLTPEEICARDMARRFVDEEVIPVIKEHFRNGTFPRELIPRLAELGFLGANIPDIGSSPSSVGYGLMMQELERGDSGLRSFVSVQNALIMYPIWKFGSDMQKEILLPLLASGEAIGCFGLTEPNHGSDPGSMELTALEANGGFILNGEKTWITNAGIADIAIIWARTKTPSSDGPIRGFIVEKDRQGFKQEKIKDEKFCFRASVTGSLILQDCWIPEENLLPKTVGLKSALFCLNEARYSIAWGVIGAASACYSAALEYSQIREQFGKKIGGFQLTQEKLVYMLNEITLMQTLCYVLGRNKDAGAVSHEQISLAKMNNTEKALEIALLAVSIFGAVGTTYAYPVMRHMLNVIVDNIYEGTREMHLLGIGKDITGFDALR